MDVPWIVLPDGIWTGSGYGDVVVAPSTLTPNVTGSFDFFEETHISCVLLEQGLSMELLYQCCDIPSSLSEDGKAVRWSEGLTDLTLYLSEDGFDGGCANGVTPVFEQSDDYVRDPAFAFAVFRQWFYEQYAFFDLRYPGGYDAWAALADTFTVNDATTDEELFDYMLQLIVPLDDGQAGLWSNFSEYDGKIQEFAQELNDEYDAIIESNVTSRRRRLEDEEEYYDDYYEEEPPGPYDLYYMSQVELMVDNIEANYLDYVNGTVEGKLVYGKKLGQDGVSCQVGYILYVDFYNEDWLDDLAMAMKTVHECEVLILDLRINPGGCDCFAFEAAGFFSEERTHVFSRRTTIRNTTDGSLRYGPYDKVYFEPAQDTSLIYKGPVVVLTSGSTGGAGEVFILAMKALPQVTVLGQPTEGSFSDMWGYTLPIGWFIFMSTEEYAWAVDGKLYEDIGFPPDVLLTRECKAEEQDCTHTSPLPLEERQSGVDSWLQKGMDYAINLIPDKPTTMSTPSPTPSNTDGSTPSDGTPSPTPSSAAESTLPEMLGLLSLVMLFVAK